jgi:O-antigen ligase
MQSLAYIFFIAYCISINFESLSLIGDSGLSIPKVIAVGYFCTVMMNFDLFKPVKRHNRLILYLAITFSLMAASTWIHAPNAGIYVPKIGGHFLNVAMLWALLRHGSFSRNVIRDGLLVFSITSSLTGLLVLLGYGIEVSTDNRVSMFGENENVFGLRLAISSITLGVLGLARRNQYAKPLIYISLSIIAGGALLYTGSRVAALSLGIAWLIMVLDFRRPTARKLALLAIACLSLPAATEYISESITFKRLNQTFELGDLAGRDLIWQDMAPSLLRHPLFGSGYSALRSRFSNYTSPHNVFLEVALTSGLAGLVFYLLYCAYIFRDAVLCLMRFDLLLPVLLLIPFLGSLLSAQALDTKIYYVIHAYILGLWELLCRERPKPSSPRNQQLMLQRRLSPMGSSGSLR